MADSTVVTIPDAAESELKEINQTPKTDTTPAAEAPVVVDRTLSSAANLVKLLPSGTVLAFQALSPSFTNKGVCYTSNKYLTSVLIHICAISCVLFSFTDTVVGRDRKHYYGFATPRGFYAFNYEEIPGGGAGDRRGALGDVRRLRIRLLDYVHAFFSVVVFLTITFSDADIQNCFFPDAGRDTRQLLVNLPLGAGFLASLVFLIFPTSRKGIGYSDSVTHKVNE